MRAAFLLLLIMGLVSGVSAVHMGNYTRANASAEAPVATLDETAYNNLITAMQPGGNETNISATADIVPDIPGALYLALNVYEDSWGVIGLVIIFSIPFIMAYIMSLNATLPAVMGLITGGFILWRLPEQYQMLAIGFIALSVIAIIYSLLKEPK